jgi:hypothetical protein
MKDVNDENVENENENKKKKDNEENNKFNNQDFLNNISEELKAEMNLLKYYSGTGKMIGAFYSGLLEEVSIDLAIEFTKVFIETYVNNLFRGQKG